MPSQALFIGSKFTSFAARASYSLLSVVSWLAAFAAFAFQHQLGLDLEDLPASSKEQRIFCLFLATCFVFAFTVNTTDRKCDALVKAEQAIKELHIADKTNMEMNQRLKELLEDKDKFILLFSHETRNPLNVLLGNLGLLLQEVDAPRLRSKLIRCKFCGELLLQQLNNILDTGKIVNKGKLEVTPTTTTTQEYIDSIQSFLEMLASRKDLDIELKQYGLPAQIRIDTHRISQVVLNILSNAVKFTNKGKVSMHVSYFNTTKIQESDFQPISDFGRSLQDINASPEVRASLKIQQISYTKLMQLGAVSPEEEKNLSPEDAGFLKFELTDTGCGIPHEHLHKLFKKFSQAHTETSKRQLGTGLGLWISKTLCELMQGDIRVYSKLNVGTCFVAIVKAEKVATPSPSDELSTSIQRHNSETHSEVEKYIPKHSKRILIADSDVFGRDVLKQMLNSIGWNEIVTLSDVAGVIEEFQIQPEGYYSTVLMDMELQDKGGWDAAVAIRKVEQEREYQKPVKIGLITDQASCEERSQCQSAPINASYYISKPVTVPLLANLLGRRKYKNGTTHKGARKEQRLVLCVDDDRFNLEMLGEMLSNQDVEALCAKSGEEAIEIVKKKVQARAKIQLILMDCMMPGKDGWTTSREIKEFLKASEAGDIPIVGVTGETKEHNEEKFDSSEMSNLIQKPLNSQTLASLLKKYAS